MISMVFKKETSPEIISCSDLYQHPLYLLGIRTQAMIDAMASAKQREDKRQMSPRPEDAPCAQ